MLKSSATSSSQVVEVVEEVFIVAELFQVYFVLSQASTIERVMIFSNLMSVLARSWHFDRSWPIGVHVAETIGNILKILLRNVLRLIQANKEMNWSHTSLSSLLRHKEKVKALVSFAVLDKVCINDRAWRWILSLAISSLNEHSLVDSLVDNDKSDWRRSTNLIVERLKSFLELCDLLIDDLLSHLLSNSISIDEKFRWRFTSMIVLKLHDSVNQASIQIFFD